MVVLIHEKVFMKVYINKNKIVSILSKAQQLLELLLIGASDLSKESSIYSLLGIIEINKEQY